MYNATTLRSIVEKLRRSATVSRIKRSCGMAHNIKRALVADDDPIIRMDACAILEDAGFATTEAEDGEAAKAKLNTDAVNYHLLFTDVEMPALDGFALARYVAEHWPHVEIVVCSGRRQPTDGELPPKATFIGKPFSARLVHEHLRRKLPDEKKPEQLQSR